MKDYWRNLDDLADTVEFREWIQREYPSQVDRLFDPLTRRGFLRLMGASLALAGLNSCSRAPSETIVPYVRQPEEIVPGKPLFFATAMPVAGFGTGVLVESHMGRPTKVEGNPTHPASLGATDVLAQASILDLYNPDRSPAITYRGRIRPWNAFLSALREALDSETKSRGAGLRILTGSVTSPTLAEQLRALFKQYPAAKWHQYEPAGRHHSRAGSLLAFGTYAQTQYRVDQADIVLALDAEALSCGPGHLRYARDFAQRRKPATGKPAMSRFYALESTPSPVGALADHRLALAPKAIEDFASAIATRLGIGAVAASAPLPPTYQRWADALVDDLKQHRGASVIIAGETMTPAVHALAHAMNSALGNIGRTVIYTEPAEANPVDEIASIKELAEDIERGNVATLIVVEGDPVYNAPADLGFAEKLPKVPVRMHLSLDRNQTSALCQWHVPAAHYLESWSDVRAYDGTVTILQPLIAPLYDGKTAHELLAALSANPQRSSYESVRDYWQQQTGKVPADFARWWRKSLHEGVVEGTAFEPKSVTPRLGTINSQLKIHDSLSSEISKNDAAEHKPKLLDLVFRPDPNIFDGRFANNAWLQELPKPLTKLTWDNAALIAPATAQRLGLGGTTGFKGGTTHADVVELRIGARALRAPVWMVPGQAENTIALHLGYGRTSAGRVGTNVGVDAYALRDAGTLWSASGVEIRRTGESYPLASTQIHHTMAGRDVVRSATQTELLEFPKTAHTQTTPPSLYPDFDYPGYAWGLSIDLNACIGCNACVVACQAENNIPVVGKQEILRSREMHWLRIDTYFKGEPDNPETYVQPVPCMHCENAPCEVVCPVAATAHSAEGLNDMVYNRCVGTRYCSNNCPYKVRRFNFLQFSDWETESLKALRNPDVTVRSRGVMEKCTYCVQRITPAKIDAGKDGRRVRDGESVTACQQVCPAEAIVFGDLNDPSSKAAALKADPRNYSLLEELNTRPRTTYLAAVRNPHPDLKKGSAKDK
ncbi:MAG: TAT-variant-translocated molybdopterin oxidoreductase [Candidatus Binatia bacterium]